MSPRPKKQRLCSGQFCGRAYKPSGIPLQTLRHIAIQQDELEVLRLCDFEGLFQVQAGERMGVSRGTVQRMLTSARRKVAEALSTGSALIFEVGEPPTEDGQSPFDAEDVV